MKPTKTHFFSSEIIFEQPHILEQIDTQNGIISSVVIAQYGENKNGSFFSERFLNQLEQAGNKAPFGIKARFGHPTMCDTALGSFIGVYKNFKIKDKKLFADLHLDNIAKTIKVKGGISMYDYILQMAQTNAHFFGNSIVVIAQPKEEIIDDKTVISLDLIEFVGSDLVDEPAATGGLFFQEQNLAGQVTDFLEQHPQIFELIEKNPQIIVSFFEKYQKYYTKNTTKLYDMSVIDTLKKAFTTQAYDLNVTLDTGEQIKLIGGKEHLNAPQIGQKAVDKDQNPLSDGQHTLANGDTITVENGVITEITPLSLKDPKEEEKKDAQIKEQVKDLFKKQAQDIEFLASSVLELTAKFEQLAKSVQSKFDVVQPRSEQFQRESYENRFSLERLKERRTQYKN